MRHLGSIIVVSTFLAAGSPALSQTGYGSSTPDGSPALKSASPRQDVPEEAYDNKTEPPKKKETSGPRPATAAEVIAGSAVKDSNGQPIGTIESVDSDGAVVSTGDARVKVPLDAFGTDGDGLLLGVTKAQFDEVVASATASPAG